MDDEYADDSIAYAHSPIVLNWEHNIACTYSTASCAWQRYVNRLLSLQVSGASLAAADGEQLCSSNHRNLSAVELLTVNLASVRIYLRRFPNTNPCGSKKKPSACSL